jgi:protein-disulfide isomerase
MIKRAIFLTTIFALALSASAQTKSSSTAAQAASATSSQSAPAANSALATKIESYLRFLFGWGPDYKVTLGAITQSSIPELLQIPVTVNHQGQDENGTVYVTKDGHFMVRGEIRDMSKDPFADNRAKLKLDDSPSIGPADAKLTIVEFSDFQCPHCRELYTILKTVEPEFPQVRWVFKNFPLVDIHPWAMTAALAGRCLYKNSPDSFFKYQSFVFENQDTVNTDNAWDQITNEAVTLGLTADALHTCMTAPETKAAVDADIAEGKALGVESTPTFFLNGRPFIGGSQQTLEAIIRFELAHLNDKP